MTEQALQTKEETVVPYSDWPSPLNVYQRLNEIRRKVGYIQKDAKVQGYKAVTHDMVTSEIRQHLIDFGVMIVPHLITSSVIDTGAMTSNGTPIIRYEATYNIDFVNIDTPEDKVTVEMEGHALDQGDKAPGKCVSYATKYAILKLFSIETGESDESRQDMKPRPITEEQAAEIESLIDEVGANRQAFLGYFKVSRVEDLREDCYSDALRMLNEKRKREQK